MSRAKQIILEVLQAAAMSTPPPAIVRHAHALPGKFLAALNDVEASGQHRNVRPGDNGHALGPFQIHKEYWIDADVPGKWEDCENYEYAVQVVQAYLYRYGKKFVHAGDFESLARLHNGGPTGMNDAHAYEYAEKFREAFANQ